MPYAVWKRSTIAFFVYLVVAVRSGVKRSDERLAHNLGKGHRDPQSGHLCDR